MRPLSDQIMWDGMIVVDKRPTASRFEATELWWAKGNLNLPVSHNGGVVVEDMRAMGRGGHRTPISCFKVTEGRCWGAEGGGGHVET